MSDSVVFNCTALMGTNKAGVLKPDKNGYYQVVLGAFDFLNSAGENYPFETAKKLFKHSSSLMRRVRNGYCRGELDHPKKEPGMTHKDYVERILTIDSKNVSHHIKSLRVDTNAIKDANNKSIVAVIGEVKPSGPYGDSLEESFKNPDENVAFSLRSLVKPRLKNGRIEKDLKVLVTYDQVNEGGISIANKYTSPSLENIAAETPVTKHIIDTIAEDKVNLGLETGDIDIAIIKTELGWNLTEISNLGSLNW